MAFAVIGLAIVDEIRIQADAHHEQSKETLCPRILPGQGLPDMTSVVLL